MSDIFMTHIHNERLVANKIKQLLDPIFGRPSIFISSGPESIGVGNNWIDAILDGLKTFKVQIVLLSPESIKREWILLEAGAGWYRKASSDENLLVIPACYGGLEVSDLQQPFSSLQATNLCNERSVKNMLFSIYKILNPNRDQREGEVQDTINRYNSEIQIFVQDLATESSSFILKKKISEFKRILERLQRFFDSSNNSENVKLRTNPDQDYIQYGSIIKALIHSKFMILALDLHLVNIKQEIDSLEIPGVNVVLDTMCLDVANGRVPYQYFSIELNNPAIADFLSQS